MNNASVLRKLMVLSGIVLGVMAPVAYGLSYTITNVGTLGGASSRPSDINADGNVAGYSYLANGEQRGFVYDGSSISEVGTFGGNLSFASGINDDGLVVGWARGPETSSNSHPFSYDGSSLTDLGNLGGNFSLARDVNNNGQIVGRSSTLPLGTERAFFYENGNMTDMGSLGGLQSEAWAINELGYATGWGMINFSDRHAFLYDGTQMQDLGTLGGADSRGLRINDSNHVVGYSDTSDGAIRGFFYDGTTMNDLGQLSGSGGSQAWGINNHDQIVGLSSGRAFIYDADLGGMLDLNECIDANSGWDLYLANAINDSGQITGYGLLNGVVSTFILTPNTSPPIPEPATMTLLGMGLIGLLVRARAKH